MFQAPTSTTAAPTTTTSATTTANASPSPRHRNRRQQQRLFGNKDEERLAVPTTATMRTSARGHNDNDNGAVSENNDNDNDGDTTHCTLFIEHFQLRRRSTVGVPLLIVCCLTKGRPQSTMVAMPVVLSHIYNISIFLRRQWHWSSCVLLFFHGCLLGGV